MKKIILEIDGMTCSSCSNGLEKYLKKQDGIINASVNLVMANASVEYDEKILDKSKIEEYIEDAGFKSLGEFKEIKLEVRNKNEKRIFIIFTILAIILMHISMGHMIGLPTMRLIDININPENHIFVLLFLTILFILYGYDILKNGYKNLIHGTPNMDTLVGIGVLSSFVYSIYSMCMFFYGDINSIHNIYFESTAIVIYFVKLGRYIDGLSKDKTKSAIQKLVTITPENAVIKIDGVEKIVTLDIIKKGDIVTCRPGEKIAVDGEITTGTAHIDESFITGESKPNEKKKGDKVIAGSINYNGYIEYKAERIGKESTISEIVKLVVEATNTKAHIAKVADTVSGYFVPAIIGIALATFIAYLLMGYNFSIAINTFVTILVVACPCSLGLATPLAIVVSEGECAENGLLVKKSEILENVQKVNTIVFDKTGTLTYGKLKVAEIKNFSDMSDKKLMQIICSLEKESSHPIAKAFEYYMEENKLGILKIEKFENVVGQGIVGNVDGKEIVLGNSKILKRYNIKNDYTKYEKELAQKGNSIVYAVIDDEIKAIIGVDDIVRDNAKNVMKELNNRKIETIMLTGDNEDTANKIAKDIGITKVIANVTPSEKEKLVEDLKKQGKLVIMCGDGINDSPALTSADIGVSISGATDIAMDSADVILTGSNLQSIVKLIDISKKTLKIIKQNLFWAFFYNILMIPIAMGLLKYWNIAINPMIASFAMVMSSFTVILNTLRLRQKSK